ncbi:hypothetical protein [Bacillus cereus]
MKLEIIKPMHLITFASQLKSSTYKKDLYPLLQLTM